MASAEDDAARLRARAGLSQDPYVDPSWGVLRNKVGARTQDELTAAETNLVEARAQQLAEHPIEGAFDLTHLRSTHRHLFQDVYAWAGELRQVNMRKANDPGGDFFPSQRLADGAANTFAQLHEDRLLGGLDIRQFVERLTVHLDQVNHLHPFREGNGRTQRIFFTQVAERAGYRIDWQQVTGAVNDAAFRAAGHGDLGQLRGMLAGIVPAPGLHLPTPPHQGRSRRCG